MAPRIVRYQGESLEYLRRLGFNAVYTSRAFSERLSNEAREAGIWLITPPPEEEVRSAGAESVFRDSGDGASNYDTVLAWTLGEAATAEDLAATQETVRALRRDRRLRRPLVVDPAERIAEYSRVADVLLIGGVSPWSATDPSRETEWQAERRKVARPGTPVWMRIETQPDPLLVEQWRILAPSLARRIGVEYEQIQASVYEALFQGARGLFFESASRLDAQDEATRSRAAALELINSQLEIIAPWTNGGTVGADAMTTDPSVKATVLRTNRALLVVPRKVAANLSAEKSEPSDGEIAMIVPGAPEASEVFELSPTGIRPLRHRRVNGGTRVTLDQLDSSTMVMMTQDPVLIGELTRRLAEQAERTARLARELATRRYELIAAAGGGSISFSVLRGGGANGSAPNLSGGSAVGQEDRLAAARTQLAECDRRMEARDWRRAYRHAIRAMELLHLDDRQAEPPSETADGTAVNSPLAVHPLLNSLDGRLVRQVAAAAPRSVVRLFDSFEDPRQSVAAGWRHIHHRHPGVATDVTFSANSPHSGRMAIRIDASAETENGGAADRELVETPPVWVVSPPVPVSAGTILLVEGWVRAPEPITEGAHSLIVFDSIGGEALAERIDSTGDWRRFRLLRAVPENGPMTVTFAMTGLGEAYVDDVSVAEIPGAAVGRLDQTRRMRGAFGAPLAPVRR